MKRVAIIGAGTSGLPCIKSCLEEGLVPVCFELTDNVGGLWNYKDEQCPERATVFRSVISNTSKHASCYSDFPHPREFPTFLPHTMFVKYFELYVKHFNLKRHIKFQHQVIKVSKSLDHEITGAWVVRAKNLETNEFLEEVFDNVLVCTGHHSVPRTPSFEGLDVFKGRTIHSQQYRTPEEFKNKRVLMIGVGNSGCDISAEVAECADQVYLSIRRGGVWILPRKGLAGTPLDQLFSTLDVLLMKYDSDAKHSESMEVLCKEYFDHERYGMKPNHRFIGQMLVINDSLPLQLLSGKVQKVGNVKNFTENGVVFDGDQKIHPIDVIIFATGYRPRFSFLDGVMDVESEITNLYRMVFPIALPKNTLAFVGTSDTDFIASINLYETQGRWAIQVFSGRIQLPPVAVMKGSAQKRANRLNELFGENHQALCLVESLPLMDEYLTSMGSKPSLLWLLITDPRLFFAYLSTPILPCKGRLCGPHSWSGARQEILSHKDALLDHLKKRNKSLTSIKGCTWTKRAGLLLVVSVGTWVIFKTCTVKGLENFINNTFY